MGVGWKRGVLLRKWVLFVKKKNNEKGMLVGKWDKGEIDKTKSLKGKNHTPEFLSEGHDIEK